MKPINMTASEVKRRVRDKDWSRLEAFHERLVDELLEPYIKKCKELLEAN